MTQPSMDPTQTVVATDRTPLERARQASEAERERFESWQSGVQRGYYHDRTAVNVTSDGVAQFISAITAIVLLSGMGRWIVEANHRFFVPDAVRPFLFRLPQLLLAVAGLTSALAMVAYLTYFVTTGRIWRRFHGVGITFAVLASLWTVTWLLDRYVLDAIFLNWVLG
jgi:hypothetical protein